MISRDVSAEIVARFWLTGEHVRVVVERGVIEAVECSSGEDIEDRWITPGFCDIQTNGRWGISYSSPELTVEDVIRIVRAQLDLGTTRLCPTLITASFEETLHGVSMIAAACRADLLVDRMVAGIHLEGPWISSEDGYRGAHPLEHVRDPNWDEFAAWQEASSRRIRLVTLAPERKGSMGMISRLDRTGVVVALGHTSADGSTLEQAVQAGARLSTHLGNGIASTLARHPNPIWNQAADDRLSATLIADGHHLDLATLRVLARAKGPRRTILVSDASPLAGLEPGSYGAWSVDPAGKIVVTGTPYLAGSNQALEIGITNMQKATDFKMLTLLQMVTTNPADLIGAKLPRIEAGQPAELVVVERDDQCEPWRQRRWP
jgi:N-acetylglucosamine-6-phosphate deacetylase